MYNSEDYLKRHLKKLGVDVKIENINELDDEGFAIARMETFGASDSSKLLNVNPFPNGDRLSLIREKLSGEWDKSIGEKPTVRCGKDLEPLILEKASVLLGTELYKPVNMYWNHKTGQSCNFDGVILRPMIPVEAKYCSQFGGKYYDFTKAVSEFDEEPVFSPYWDEHYKEKIIEEYIKKRAEDCGIPAYYYTQIQHQMDFLDAPYGYLVVQNQKDWTTYIFTIARDDICIDELRKVSTSSYAMLNIKRDAQES